MAVVKVIHEINLENDKEEEDEESNFNQIKTTRPLAITHLNSLNSYSAIALMQARIQKELCDKRGGCPKPDMIVKYMLRKFNLWLSIGKEDMGCMALTGCLGHCTNDISLKKASNSCLKMIDKKGYFSGINAKIIKAAFNIIMCLVYMDKKPGKSYRFIEQSLKHLEDTGIDGCDWTGFARHMKSTLCVCWADDTNPDKSKTRQAVAKHELVLCQQLVAKVDRAKVTKFTTFIEVMTLGDLATIELGFPVNYHCVVRQCSINLEKFVYNTTSYIENDALANARKSMKATEAKTPELIATEHYNDCKYLIAKNKYLYEVRCFQRATITGSDTQDTCDALWTYIELLWKELKDLAQDSKIHFLFTLIQGIHCKVRAWKHAHEQQVKVTSREPRNGINVIESSSQTSDKESSCLDDIESSFTITSDEEECYVPSISTRKRKRTISEEVAAKILRKTHSRLDPARDSGNFSDIDTEIELNLDDLPEQCGDYGDYVGIPSDCEITVPGDLVDFSTTCFSQMCTKYISSSSDDQRARRPKIQVP